MMLSENACSKTTQKCRSSKCTKTNASSNTQNPTNVRISSCVVIGYFVTH